MNGVETQAVPAGYLMSPQAVESRRVSRPVNIEPVMNGFIVQVGCQRLVWQGDSGSLFVELARYFADPQGVEVEYSSKYGQTYC